MASDDPTLDALGNPLDETAFHNPQGVQTFQGVHDNTVLYYFATSPFFDCTSKNHIAFETAVASGPLERIATRAAFEAYLKSFTGLEYVVAQEPAETGHGTGTGVWVIRKQHRTVPVTGEHIVRPLADYFLVGETIYQAPTFADVLTSRIATISNAIAKIAPAAAKIQKWSPSTGHIYQTPASTSNALANASAQRSQSKEPTPMPDNIGTPSRSQRANGISATNPASGPSAPDALFAEESLLIHMRHGGEYMDENPITGRPGDFHFKSTGRKGEKALAPPTLQIPGGDKTAPSQGVSAGAGETAGPSPLSREAGKEKGRSGAPKPKRRKSKGGTTTPS